MVDIKMAIVGREIQALRDDATQQFTNSDRHHCTLQYSTEQMTNTTRDVTPRAKNVWPLASPGMYSTEDD